jgi:Mor family transcriptional regulator
MNAKKFFFWIIELRLYTDIGSHLRNYFYRNTFTMKLEEAQQKLSQAREHQKRLSVEIDALKEILIGYGIEPHQGCIELKERNNEIYQLYKKGMSFTVIAKKYNLSSTRIASICHGIDYKKPRKNHYPRN